MKIVGLMGAIGCGKGTVAEILVKDYGFNPIILGDLVREEVKAKGLEPTRELTTKVSEELRKKDPAHFIKKAVSKINDNKLDKVVVDGIRLPLDVKELKKNFPNMIFVLVKTDPKTRFERMRLRARPGFPENFKKFLEHEKLEADKFNLNETWRSASRIISNDGSLQALKNQVIELIEDLGWV